VSETKKVNPIEDLKNIYRDAVREVDPAALIQSRVKKDGRILLIHGQDTKISEDLSRYEQVLVLGIGKASALMAAAMESILEGELSAGTDGSDGPTDAAGAFVTPELMEKMKAISAQAAASLAENDSYNFFNDTGNLFKTGPTYTNVCDIQILMVI